MKRLLCGIALAFGLSSLGADVPGSHMRTATQLPLDTYEMLVSPSYVVAEKGSTYLSAELRYQPYESFAAGFGFGVGDLGFNFGAHGIWNVLTSQRLVPRIAILTGTYFNRVAGANYFVVKVAPTVSHTFEAAWGNLTPYGAIAFSPSFRLVNTAANLFSIKGSLGNQLSLKGLDGLRVLTEVSLGLLNSTYEIGLGISYPFAAL